MINDDPLFLCYFERAPTHVGFLLTNAKPLNALPRHRQPIQYQKLRGVLNTVAGLDTATTAALQMPAR